MSSSKTKNEFARVLVQDKSAVERRLSELTDSIPNDPPVIKEAVLYSLLDGGKRLRPILCLWTHDLLKGTRRDACLDMACAIEALHTYSLIHDDLPSMDNDDMRRGKPSSHKKFGEATAILVGDALLTFCFEVMLAAGTRWDIDDRAIVESARVVSEAAGMKGLISGQVLDLEAERKRGDLEMVERIHARKTAVLISATMEVGAIVAGAGMEARKIAGRAGFLAGRAFQIIDDVLDVETGEDKLGKTAGKDAAQGKLTFPAVAGMEGAKAEALSLIEAAKDSITEVGDANLLAAMFDYFAARKY
jgi:geranylgeranyl pyrophosphate synthase